MTRRRDAVAVRAAQGRVTFVLVPGLGLVRTLSLLVFDGRREEASAAMRDVVACDPRNPYYQWVVPGAP